MNNEIFTFGHGIQDRGGEVEFTAEFSGAIDSFFTSGLIEEPSQ